MNCHKLLKTKPDHERGEGIASEDITSYLESQRGWGPERDGRNEDGSYREGNWPEILYQIQKPGNFLQSDPQYPGGVDWLYHGRIVLSVHDNLPLLKYDTLPDTISSKITGLEMEALLRLNPKVKTRDIVGRMPMYYLSDEGRRLLLYTSSTISMRTSRFRKENALMCWRTRGGTDRTNDMIKAYLEEREPLAIQVGSVQGVGHPPKDVVDALSESNKDNPSVTNRAGQKYALGDQSARHQPAPPARAPAGRLDKIEGNSDSEAMDLQLTRNIPSPRSIVQQKQSRAPPSSKKRPRSQSPDEHQPEGPEPPRRRSNTEARHQPAPLARAPPGRSDEIEGNSDSEAINPQLTRNILSPRSIIQQRQRHTAPPALEERPRGNRSRSPDEHQPKRPELPRRRPNMKNLKPAVRPQPPEQLPAATTIQQPQQQDALEQLPVVSIPPPRTKARVKYVTPPPRRRDSRSRSPARNDERGAVRGREPLAQNPTTRQTRSQASIAVQPPTQQQQKQQPPGRGPKRNPPMTLPRPPR